MRSRKPLLVVAISILITAALACGAWCEDKRDILRNLRREAVVSQSSLTKYASSLKQKSKTEATQLAFDLIVYRWLWSRPGIALRIAGKTPIETKSNDNIITALTTALDDPAIKWASSYYAVSASVSVSSPPRGDKRVEALQKLKKYVAQADKERGSSPINAVKALDEACNICDDSVFYLDMAKGLLLKEKADHYQYTMSNYPQADSCYDTALGLFSDYGCSIAYAVTYEDWAELEQQLVLPDYSKTATRYELAAAKWVELSKEHPNTYEYLDLAGQDLINAGNAWFATTQKPNNPLNTMLDGLKRLEEWTYANNKPVKTYDALIHSRLDVVDYLLSYLETTEAKNQIQKAEELCVKQSQTVQAEFSGDFEKFYRKMNLTQKADEWKQKREKWLYEDVTAANEAVKSLSASPDKSRSELIKLCDTLERGAQAHHGLGSYENAAELWQIAADHYTKLGLANEQIRALRSQAREMVSQQKPKESLDIFFKAVITAKDSGYYTEAASIVNEMVFIYNQLGDLNNALEAYMELAPLLQMAGDKRGEATIFDYRGRLLLQNEKYEDAIRNFQEARKMYIDQVGDFWAACEVSARLAEAYDKADKMESASEMLESSLNLIEYQFSMENLSSGAVKKHNSVIRNLYNALAITYIKTGQKDRATTLLQKRGLSYKWRPELIKALTASTDREVAAFAKDLPLTSLEPPEIAMHGESATRAKDSREFIQACWWLEQNNRAVYNALPIDPIEVFRNRNRLPKDTAVVLYMVAETSLYTFIYSYDNVTIIETRRQRSELDGPIRQLRKLIRTCEGNVSQKIPVQQITTWQEQVFLDIKAPLQELYGLLIKHTTGNISGYRRLVFVLPDALAGLPIHALVSSGSETVPRFLIEDYEIGYLGPRMLEYLVSKDNILDSGTAKLVVFSDPLGNLPGAQDETKTILRNYPNNSRAYQKSSATETTFMKECQVAGIIHIAAHHRIDADQAQFQMRLAADANSDGIVEIGELSAIQAPQLGLVVLSACDSIASSDMTSPGLSRAVEAFSDIGAKSVMGGLWKVSDEAAGTLMDVFYNNIAKGHVSRAESLRRAQLDMIKKPKFAHPFYWACFALYGNPR